ncbi:MAG: hypothetical protein U9R79_15420 [Armatimonadota bacterium]|nr:hypothetical protein [Armatimonadota bacterium]
MSEQILPTTTIEGYEIGRLVIGTNWFLGYSHISAAKSRWIQRYQDTEKIARVLEVCSAGGMNATVAPVSELMTEALRLHEERTGRHIIQILTPGGATTEELMEGIDETADLGAEFCLPHTSWTDARLHPARNEITDWPRVAEYIRKKGMIPGLSTHRPEAIVVGDRAGYDIGVYIQPINPIGFLCSVETDWVAGVINRTEKPVIVIKPLAAGRVNPPTGLGFVFSNIKPIDVVCIGLLCEEEAEEDLEITRQILAQQRADTELEYTRSKASLTGE